MTRVSSSPIAGRRSPPPNLPRQSAGWRLRPEARDRGCPSVHAELGERVFEMTPNRPWGDEQLVGDLRIGPADCDKLKDLVLTGRQYFRPVALLK